MHRFTTAFSGTKGGARGGYCPVGHRVSHSENGGEVRAERRDGYIRGRVHALRSAPRERFLARVDGHTRRRVGGHVLTAGLGRRGRRRLRAGAQEMSGLTAAETDGVSGERAGLSIMPF